MRRRRVFAGVFLLMFGMLPLLRMVGNPRFETLHGSDVVGLIASGLCFGFGLALLLGRIMFRGE
jgi:hypothetical protein